MNHASYIENTSYKWINIVRDPIDRLSSWYYFYKIDAIKQMSYDFNGKIFHHPKENPGNLPYPQWKYFCSQSNCKLEDALENLMKYDFIGITEEMYLNFVLLSQIFPNYFETTTNSYKNSINIKKVNE